MVAEIIHGDCLDVMRGLDANSVDGIATDPPYASGGRQQAGARNIVSKSERDGDDWFLGDNMGSDSYLWWMREIARQSVRVARPGSQAFVFTDWRQYSTVVSAWETVGWTLRSVVVWDKNKGGAMGSFWRNNHEWVPVFVKGKPRPLAHHSAFNTWSGSKPQGGLHPTEKPVDFMRYLISTIAPEPGRPAPLILDPFTGSGTTGVACAVEGFRFIGIERDLRYVELARQRIAGVAPSLALGAA